MPELPSLVNAEAIAGSLWDKGYQLFNEDSSLMNITTKTFSLVIRPTVTDASPSPLVSVSSQQATVQGYITVDTNASTLLVVLSPTATALLGRGARPYAVIMNPGLVDATDVIVGTFSSVLAANP